MRLVGLNGLQVWFWRFYVDAVVIRRQYLKSFMMEMMTRTRQTTCTRTILTPRYILIDLKGNCPLDSF